MKQLIVFGVMFFTAVIMLKEYFDDPCERDAYYVASYYCKASKSLLNPEMNKDKKLGGDNKLFMEVAYLEMKYEEKYSSEKDKKRYSQAYSKAKLKCK